MRILVGRLEALQDLANGSRATNPDDLHSRTRVNQFMCGQDKEDLAWLVERYNEEFAGKLTASGQIVPRVTLPAKSTSEDAR